MPNPQGIVKRQSPIMDLPESQAGEKLNYIEQAISKLEYSQDSLLPLMKLAENIPNLQNNRYNS